MPSLWCCCFPVWGFDPQGIYSAGGHAENPASSQSPACNCSLSSMCFDTAIPQLYWLPVFPYLVWRKHNSRCHVGLQYCVVFEPSHYLNDKCPPEPQSVYIPLTGCLNKQTIRPQNFSRCHPTTWCITPSVRLTRLWFFKSFIKDDILFEELVCQYTACNGLLHSCLEPRQWLLQLFIAHPSALTCSDNMFLPKWASTHCRALLRPLMKIRKAVFLPMIELSSTGGNSAMVIPSSSQTHSLPSLPPSRQVLKRMKERWLSLNEMPKPF